MTIKQAHADKKHTTPGLDSSNCNTVVYTDISLVGFIYYSLPYAYFILMPATLLLASVNSTDSNHYRI